MKKGKLHKVGRAKIKENVVEFEVDIDKLRCPACGSCVVVALKPANTDFKKFLQCEDCKAEIRILVTPGIDTGRWH